MSAEGADSLTLRTAGPVSAVIYRGGPAPGEGRGAYYVYADGEVRAPYLSPEDGLSRAAAPALIVFSPTAGCVELVLATGGLYSAESLDVAALRALAGEGIFAAWLQDGAVVRTDAAP